MSIKSALATYLAANAGILAVAVGGVWPVALSQDSNGKITPRPALTYRRMPSDHEHELEGGGGYSFAMFRLTAWGDQYSDADALGEAIRLAMQGFNGTVAGTEIGTVVLKNDFDEYVQPPDGSSQGFFAVHHDYKVGYVESVPQNSNELL